MTLRLEDDRPLAVIPAAVRVIARVVLAQGERGRLLAFGMADDHLHAGVATDRATAGSFAHSVECALRMRLALGSRFEAARIRPLHDQRHAYNTFHYVHRQDSRHELHRDLFREGTSLPDLLGLRVLDSAIGARVRMHLPRVRREELVAQFPPGIFDDRPVDVGVLADAGAAALAISSVHGRSSACFRARRAAVHVAGPEASTKLLAECLGIGPRAVQELRALPNEPLVVRAVRLQALLRTPQTAPPARTGT